MSLIDEGTETTGRLSRGHRREPPFLAVQINCGAHVDVADAVSVGQAEFSFFAEIGEDPLDAAANHRLVARVDQRHAPGLRRGVVDLHAVVPHVKGYVRLVQEIVLEVLLDDVPLVAKANNKVINSLSGVYFHHVPNDGHSAHFNHRLRLDVSLFRESRAQAASKYYRFHSVALV